MLDLCAGFVYSQVLFACVRLRLFELLRGGPLTTPELAVKMALSEDATRRLLDAAASLDLAQRRGENRYGLGQLAAALLGSPEALALIEHQPLLYADLADPVALLRGERETALSRYWPYSAAERPDGLSAEEVGPYSALMAASQPLVAREAMAVYPIEKHRRLLDVGGGEGVFLAAAAERAPALELELFDLPAVAERARARLSGLGLSGRVKIHGGNFLRDPLPRGADVISLARIVHDHDDASALALLRNARAALPPGGDVVDRRGDLRRQGRRAARRLLRFLHAGDGPRRAARFRGNRRAAAGRRLRAAKTLSNPPAGGGERHRRDGAVIVSRAASMRQTVATTCILSVKYYTFRRAVSRRPGWVFG